MADKKTIGEPEILKRVESRQVQVDDIIDHFFEYFRLTI